ncbi:MAG: serine hydrolase [Xanthomonadales bacterium]|nr:beta-lactamase family protein [Xanthomonadales bacterium]NIX14242.1 serine hydrolase [Xanthomonadales bacterium]
MKSAIFRRFMRATGPVSLLLILMTVAIYGQDPACAGEVRGTAIDALFTHFDESSQPGAAVMVIRDGKVVHARGYGLADLETGAPITPDTVFRLGSVSKMFTAMAIAILADRGDLGLDDPAGEYVPALAHRPDITVRHLLTHTSGLPDYYDEFDASPWTQQGRIPSNADTIAHLGRMEEVLFEPGERYEYSNPAYEVLSLIVEAVADLPFRDFMRDEVFAPAGMGHSVIHDDSRPRIAARALGYSPDGDRYVLDDDDPLNGITGSGSQFSPLMDFLAWDRAIASGSLLSEAMQSQVFTRAILNDGSEIDYGFGWRLDEYRGHARTAHGGSWVGFRTAFTRYPGLGLTIMILSNRSDYDPTEASDRLADLFLGD